MFFIPKLVIFILLFFLHNIIFDDKTCLNLKKMQRFIMIRNSIYHNIYSQSATLKEMFPIKACLNI